MYPEAFIALFILYVFKIFITKKKSQTFKNKVVTKLQAQSNCDVTSFRSDMGTDGPTNGQTNQPT
jgi:hypothetical protein